ncbi:MAG: type V toxin-antitoxin system endoribonuclease antitoxin GhoS [Candidatus Pacebacteria bacterium]|nr:type V toxin-antitoxin system endoribonuclease antitoxin GhoS [Candidatus Paceibacterota bacterium]
MTTYTIRVELHSNQYNPDFTILHNAMVREGFDKVIRADNGKVYHLPRGGYIISTIKSCSEVLNSAKRAVQSTKNTAEIFVSELTRWMADGLIEKR